MVTWSWHMFLSERVHYRLHYSFAVLTAKCFQHWSMVG